MLDCGADCIGLLYCSSLDTIGLSTDGITVSPVGTTVVHTKSEYTYSRGRCVEIATDRAHCHLETFSQLGETMGVYVHENSGNGNDQILRLLVTANTCSFTDQTAVTGVTAGDRTSAQGSVEAARCYVLSTRFVDYV